MRKRRKFRVHELLGYGQRDLDENRARDLFLDIQAGRFKGVTSALAVFETMDVVKRLVVEKGGITPTPFQMEHLEQKILQDLRALKIEVIDTDEITTGLKAILDKVGFLIKNTPATIVRDVNSGRKRGKSLGVIDALHIAVAERATSQFIMSKDSSFKDVDASKSSACGVLLREEYP